MVEEPGAVVSACACAGGVADVGYCAAAVAGAAVCVPVPGVLEGNRVGTALGAESLAVLCEGGAVQLRVYGLCAVGVGAAIVYCAAGAELGDAQDLPSGGLEGKGIPHLAVRRV